MKLRPLEELMKLRKKLRRDVKYYDEGEWRQSALAREGLWTPEEVKFYSDIAHEALADVEQEIAERTGQVPPE